MPSRSTAFSFSCPVALSASCLFVVRELAFLFRRLSVVVGGSCPLSFGFEVCFSGCIGCLCGYLSPPLHSRCAVPPRLLSFLFFSFTPLSGVDGVRFGIRPVRSPGWSGVAVRKRVAVVRVHIAEPCSFFPDSPDRCIEVGCAGAACCRPLADAPHDAALSMLRRGAAFSCGCGNGLRPAPPERGRCSLPDGLFSRSTAVFGCSTDRNRVFFVFLSGYPGGRSPSVSTGPAEGLCH